MIPGLIVCVYYSIKKVKIPKILTSSSFGIYVTNGLISYCITAFYGVIGLQGKELFILGFIRFILTLSLSIIITIFLKRTFPNISKIVFGGR